MMRLIKISILWIAGILVLGHSIIPHHHHNADQTECNSQQDNSKTTLSFTDNSFCNHHETHDEICHLDQTTTIKKSHTLSTTLTIDIFNLSAPENYSKVKFSELSTNVLPNSFQKKKPSRAPPIV